MTSTSPTKTASLHTFEIHCTDLLSDNLQGYRGIKTVEVDLNHGQIKAVYDQDILSNEMALQVMRQSGRDAVRQACLCAAEREQGLPGCTNCTEALGKKLIACYQAAADLTTSNIHNGLIAANFNQESITDHNSLKLVTSTMEDSRGRKGNQAVSREKLAITFTTVNAVAGLVAWLGAAAGLQPLVVGIFYAVSYAFGGYFGVAASLQAFKEKSINVDMLMLFAALGAALVGSPAEGAMLLFLFSLSNTLQTLAMDRSRKAIEKLLDLRPAIATVRRGSRLVSMPVEQLVLADLVLVRPGERFPIDGEIITGETYADQSTITGESIPVHKTAGDEVFASTINGAGSAEVRVTRLAGDTTLARIVRLVEEAQLNKSSTQRVLDKFENSYALFVLGSAIFLTLIPWLLLRQGFQPSFYRAMIWLVVASPCALVISTPASVLSAIANAARNGVLFKGGIHLEKTSRLKVVAFDKTGTLTSGKPELTMIHIHGDEMDEDTVLGLAAALESRSEHPLAQSVVQKAQEHNLTLPTVTDFRSSPGLGVEGRVTGQEIWIGNERMFTNRQVEIPQNLLSKAREMETAGQTVMFVYIVPQFAGLLGMADILRTDAIEMIKGLKKIGIQRVVMLTGDNPRVAANIAARAGVDEFYAGLLPQDKVGVLKELQEKYGPVAMVGDGVNDAPSLATADIGIAMGGGGTDVAIETADVVLMSDALNKIPFAIGLARQAEKVVWQNLAFAMAVIAILISTALGAKLPLPLGVLGHEGSTVLVVLNGLRLLNYTNLK